MKRGAKSTSRHHGKVSLRQCLVCRGRGTKGELLRFVFAEGSLVWDQHQRAQGRGVYLHAAVSCLSKRGEPTQWNRSLRLTERTGGGVTREGINGALRVALQKALN